eukprot:UN01334
MSGTKAPKAPRAPKAPKAPKIKKMQQNRSMSTSTSAHRRATKAPPSSDALRQPPVQVMSRPASPVRAPSPAPSRAASEVSAPVDFNIEIDVPITPSAAAPKANVTKDLPANINAVSAKASGDSGKRKSRSSQQRQQQTKQQQAQMLHLIKSQIPINLKSLFGARPQVRPFSSVNTPDSKPINVSTATANPVKTTKAKIHHRVHRPQGNLNAELKALDLEYNDEVTAKDRMLALRIAANQLLYPEENHVDEPEKVVKEKLHLYHILMLLAKIQSYGGIVVLELVETCVIWHVVH